MSTMPIPRLPNPLTPETIGGLMKARPYWNLTHPRSPLYRRLVQRGFEIMYPGPTLHDEFGRMADTPPQPPERIAHLVAKENREMEDMEREFDERGGAGGAVHVQSHAREGGKVEVADYWRSRPGEGAESERSSESPKARKLLDEAADAGDAQASADDSKSWENRPNLELREAIAGFEQSVGKPNDGYGERHEVSGALGRYQIMPGTLDGIGWRNPDGTWTTEARKHGVASDEDFLKNPQAQEEALDRVFAQYEKEAGSKGLFDRVGQKIEGREGSITVTKAGIIAAVHNGGAGGTRRYLEKIDRAGGVSRDAPLTAKERAIETRMRKAQNLDYRRGNDR